jgi:hypothetical protein
LSTTSEDLCATDEDAWIDTERPTDQAQNDDHADAETATAAGYAQATTARRARLAVILDVATLAQILPAHISLPSKFLAIALVTIAWPISQSNRGGSPARSLSSRILALYQRRRTYVSLEFPVAMGPQKRRKMIFNTSPSPNSQAIDRSVPGILPM